MNDSKEIIAIKVPLNRLKELRDDPKFILILQLSRFINQLMYFHKVWLGNEDTVTPVGVRHTLNTFLYMCATLYEALKLITPLRTEFRSYRTFQEGLEKLSRDPDMNLMKEKVLSTMRNELIFHVDAKPFKEALNNYDTVRRIDLIRTTSEKQGDIHYNLADELVLNYIIGVHGSVEAELEYFKDINEKIITVMTEFIQCSSNLINEYVQRKHWKSEPIPSN